MLSSDTIVAPATPVGESAIAVLRCSGPDAPAIAEALLGKKPPVRRPTLFTYRTLQDQILDQPLLTWFPAPSSYTGEHLIEITPHGNPYLTRRILDDLIARGCRLAEPGEFTRLAFLNGKLDLSQAEAVMDLIRARSDASLEAARQQLDGSLSRAINKIVEQLLHTLSHLEAYLDFPEEDLPPENDSGPLLELRAIADALTQLIATEPYAELLRDGVKVVLAGPTNAGKSSLLNALAGDDRALVSEEAGTTRDWIEVSLRLGPYLVHLLDTAGLRVSDAELEQRGMEATRKLLKEGDLLLLVLDQSSPTPELSTEDIASFHPARSLVISNKADLEKSPHFQSPLPDIPVLEVSSRSGAGLEDLRQAIIERFENHPAKPAGDVLVSARHAQALRLAREAILSTRQKLTSQAPPELAATDLREALEALGQITGRIDNEAMLDVLFQTFCIGK